jgi:hypothetical protein
MEKIKILLGIISLFIGLQFYGFSILTDKIYKKILLAGIGGLFIAIYKIL